MTDGITYDPTRDHWTPYEPWMRHVLADDARVSLLDEGERRSTWASWASYGFTVDGWMAGRDARIHPDDVPERPTENVAYRAHRAAVQHLQDLTEAMWAEEDGTEVDWAELGAVGPYDGCEDCVVREVATVVVAELEAGGVIRFLDRGDEREEQA